MSKDIKELPDVLKVDELQDFLRIGRNQAYNLCKRKDFYPSFKVGDKSVRISKKQLLEWLKENEI